MTIRQRFIVFYIVVFTSVFVINLLFGNSLTQTQPIFYLASLDFSEAILFAFNVPNYLISNPVYFLIIDVGFVFMNAFMVYLAYRNSKYSWLLIVFTILFNLFVALVYNLFTVQSTQGFLCWVWLPIVFLGTNGKCFYFTFNAVRYLFVLFFFSAALWKLRTGCIFSLGQMPAILLQQHTATLALQESFFSTWLYAIINNKWLAWSLFLGGFLCEFVFIIGFFTKKYDKVLALIFLLFLLADFLLMRINYFSWCSYLPLLWFSRKIELK
jgi:hypothetical protein